MTQQLTGSGGLIIAAVLMVVLADYAPHLVNWLLAIILAGIVLKNKDQWVPLLQRFGGTPQSLGTAAGAGAAQAIQQAQAGG